MNKFTPGPWEIVTDSYGRAFIRHPLDAEHREAGYFAQVRDYTANEEKTMANARLIAAAPLMYEALRKFTVGYMDAPGDVKLEDNPLGDEYDQAMAALDAANEGSDER